MIDDILDYYIQLKRIFFNIPFIPIPKEGSKDYANLTALSDMFGKDCMEYIILQVRTYKRRNVFPSTAQLLGNRAKERWGRHNRMTQAYIGETYIEKDGIFYVKNTGQYYDVRQARCSIEEDYIVTSVMIDIRDNLDFSTWEEEGLKKLWLDTQYVLAKFEYKYRQPPDKLIEFVERVNDINKKSSE